MKLFGSKTSDNGGSKISAKAKSSDAKAAEGQKRWRAMQTGFRAIASEMKRVTWPTREEWVSATLVVIGLVVVVAIWTAVVSKLAGWIFGSPE